MHEAKDCKCSVRHSSAGEPTLLLDVETPSCHFKFKLRTTTRIQLVGRFSYSNKLSLSIPGQVEDGADEIQASSEQAVPHICSH